jgi:hypothetical protein
MSFNAEELENKKEEVVRIIQGAENALSAMLYCISSARETIDLYAEGIGIYTAYHYPENLKLHKEALDRGVRTRLITEITKDNLPYVKEALPYLTDVRHMDTITHYFGVSEKHYLSNKLQYGDPALTQSIFSNVSWFVREQQYLFETLWNKAIPLKQRIREIEEGRKRQFVDTIRDPTEVLSLLPNLISSAYGEIMLLFPSLKTLRSFESAGLAQSIKNHTQKNNKVRVKLLLKGREGERVTGGGEKIEEYIENDYDGDYSHYQRHPRERLHSNSQLKDSSSNTNKLIGQGNVEVKFLDPDQIDTKTALVIVDGEKMITVELGEDEDNDHGYDSSSSSSTQPNLTDSIRFATHTNSESAVNITSTIFERMWIESEMKQRKQ